MNTRKKEKERNILKVFLDLSGSFGKERGLEGRLWWENQPYNLTPYG